MKQKFAFLCIDLQKEYFDKNRPLFVAEGPEILKNVISLLRAAREKKITVIHIKHICRNLSDTTFRAETPFIEFVPEATPRKDEYIITKNLPGAFSGTNLDTVLKSLKISDIIICGLTSFLCCDTTSREAHAKGYNVYFISDATAALDIEGTPAKEIHKIVCAIQKWYFAKIFSTQEMLNIIQTQPSD